MLAGMAMSTQVFHFDEGANSVDTVTRLDIDSSTRTLIDQNDRQVLLHGVNVVYKVAPYIPSDGSWDPEDTLDDKDI